MKKINFFNRHLDEAGENYFEHFIFSFPTAMWILITGMALLIHSFLPFTFTFTTSKNLKKINQILQKRVEILSERRLKRNQENVQ